MTIGIPPLLNQAASVTNPAALLVSDALIIKNLLTPSSSSQWGIFYQGKKVIEPDSIVSQEFKNEWNIPNAPQEAGSFESYNKIATPAEHHIVMTKGGTIAEKNTFLNQVEAAAASLNLYSVVTPEHTYLNANIQRIDGQRNATSGAGLLTINVALQEIRQAPIGTLTSSSNNVNPNQPTQAQVTQALQALAISH